MDEVACVGAEGVVTVLLIAVAAWALTCPATFIYLMRESKKLGEQRYTPIYEYLEEQR